MSFVIVELKHFTLINIYCMYFNIFFWSANIIRTIERENICKCVAMRRQQVQHCWLLFVGVGSTDHISVFVLSVEPQPWLWPRLGWNAVILSTEDLALDLYLSSLLPEP